MAHADMPIFTRTFDLLTWLLPVSNHFPRAHRHTFTRGLPIGNLTSQLWANVYLDPLDQFVKRELKCPAYVRYVDDCAPRRRREETVM